MAACPYCGHDSSTAIAACVSVLTRASAAEAALATLTARVAELEAGLKPFAEIAEAYDEREDDTFGVWADAHEADIRAVLRLGNFRRARALLQKDTTNG